jgi:hypothetical protein
MRPTLSPGITTYLPPISSRATSAVFGLFGVFAVFEFPWLLGLFTLFGPGLVLLEIFTLLGPILMGLFTLLRIPSLTLLGIPPIRPKNSEFWAVSLEDEPVLAKFLNNQLFCDLKE